MHDQNQKDDRTNMSPGTGGPNDILPVERYEGAENPSTATPKVAGQKGQSTRYLPNKVLTSTGYLANKMKPSKPPV